MIYGHNKTIHGTRHLNVEVGPDGKVVSVWFRCLRLPFTEHRVDQARAQEMATDTKAKINAIDVSIEGVPDVQGPQTYPGRLLEKEQIQAERFERRHRTCQNRRDRFKYTFVATGVGSGVKVTCLNCRKFKDISDYDSW